MKQLGRPANWILVSREWENRWIVLFPDNVGYSQHLVPLLLVAFSLVYAEAGENEDQVLHPSSNCGEVPREVDRILAWHKALRPTVCRRRQPFGSTNRARRISGDDPVPMLEESLLSRHDAIDDNNERMKSRYPRLGIVLQPNPRRMIGCGGFGCRGELGICLRPQFYV